MKTLTTKKHFSFKYCVVFAITAVIGLSGCQSVPATKPQADTRMDKTIGNYGKGLESNLVLVTMKPEEHARLTITNNKSSGSLPLKYFHFIDRLSTTYGITRVADWPLPAINIHCIIFENHGKLSRESLVTALTLEPGVESVQAVNTFNVQTIERPEVHPQTYHFPHRLLQLGTYSSQTSISPFRSRGKAVKVAVVETGGDNNHSVIRASTDNTINFVDLEEEKIRSNTHDMVEGKVNSTVENGDTATISLTPDTELFPVKACWHVKKGKGDAQCNTITLAKALNYSIKENVNIIFLSLFGPQDPILNRLVTAAIDRNIAVVDARSPRHSFNTSSGQWALNATQTNKN